MGLSGRVVVVANGNNGNHGRPGNSLHVSGSVPANGTVSFGVTIPPNNTVTDRFDLWYSGNGRLRLHRRPIPRGRHRRASMIAAPGSTGAQAATVGCDDTVSVISSVNLSQNNKNQDILFGIIPAVPTNNTTTPSIAAGTWIITLRETAGTAVTLFDCWTDVSHEGGFAGFVPASISLAPGVTAPTTQSEP